MKEYRSRWSMLVFDVVVDGKRKHIEFRGMRDGGSYYTTSDSRTIEQLEKNAQYGVDFYLFEDRTASEVLEQEEPVAEEVRKMTFGNINELREYLKQEGVDYRKLNTPNAIMRQAEELGIAVEISE